MSKRLLSLFMAVLMLLAFCTGGLTTVAIENNPTISVSKEVGNASDEVSIDITIDNSPGLWGMDLKISYDKSALTLLSVTNGTFFKNSEWTKGNLNADIYTLSYEAAGFDNIKTVSSILATLVFKINEGTPAGEYAITASYNLGDIININFDDLVFTTIDGSITVKANHEHTFNVKTINNNALKTTASCTSDAEYYYSCECGEISTTETFLDEGSKLNHTGGIATCARKAVCEKCGEEYGEFDANNHNWNNGSVTDPTCITEGYTTYTCTNCGTTKIDNNVSKIDHNWDSGTVTKEDSCVDKGEITYSCTNEGCNATKTEPIPIDETNHTNVDLVGAKEATCKESGYTGDKVCQDCKATIEIGKKINKLAHTPVSANNCKPATCTEDGKDADTICSVCGETLTTGKVISVTGHKGGTATCSAKAICEVCRQPYGELDALGHQWSVATTQPTCTKDGVKKFTCTVCGEIKNEPIAKLGHSYTAKVVEPTCTKKGYTLYTCSRCNDNYEKNETNATGHQWGDPVTTTKPTYTKNGVDTYTCKVCGNTKEDSIEKLPIPAVSSFKTAAYTSKSITLSWKAVSGATLYTVYRYNSSTKKFAKIGYSRTNSYSDSSLSPGTTYYYIVRVAVKNGSSYIYSPNSVTLKTSTSPDTAKAKIAAYSQTAIKFTWSKVSGATAYEIYIFKNNKWTKLATVTTASYTAKNLSKGTTYQFRVRATRTVSSVKYNAKYETVAFSTKTSTPTTPTVTSSAKKTATIKWSAVSGATGYQIYYSTSKSGTFKKLASVSGKSYTNAKFTSGKIYYFKIRTYRTVNGVNYYSSLSSTRAVKIK